MMIAVDTKEAKYTQGFSFRQDGGTPGNRTRQIVERTCSALMTLLQELFVQAERQVSGQLTEIDSPLSRQCLLEQLVEIVKARVVVERAMMTSILCAFAELEDRARAGQENQLAIAQTLQVLKEPAREAENLMRLLEAREKIAVISNGVRPLLFHLNAQWVVLFGLPEFRMQNSPLAPATLVAGFVAGLACIDASLSTRRLLFRMFDQHVLARLSILLNSITLRLEEEGTQVNRAASFDELDVGPIREVFQAASVIDQEKMRENRERMVEALSRKKNFVAIPVDIQKTLDPLLKDSRVETYADLWEELAVIKRGVEPTMLRADIHHQETTALIAIRCHIAEQLNQQLAGKLLPVSMREFFSQQWPDVLFEAMVSGGIEGDDWANAMALQRQLLESASPVDNEDRRRNLSRLVPSLVKNLRESLERAGYSLAELSLFFTQLKELHLTNVQGKLVTQDFVSWQPLSPEAWVPTETVMASTADRYFYEQLRAVIG